MICAGLRLSYLSITAAVLRRAILVGSSECSSSSPHSGPAHCPKRSMASSSTRTFVISPKEAHSGTVIFLHGLGDTGEGWSQALRTIAAPNVKYVFPTAPTMPVSLNMGFAMPSWFDIHGLGAEAKQDEAGIEKAAENLRKLVNEEVENGIAASRIVIGGFSQGGAVALYTTLTDSRKLGGCIGLSTWLPLHKQVAAAAKENGRQTPILQCHGDADPMVNISFGQTTAAFLKQFCKKHEFKVYRGLMHSSSQEEIADVSAFLKEQFAQGSA